MSDMEKYYQILGLNPRASEEDIKEAYKDLIKVWHPDRFSDNERLKEKANEKLKEIILAYKNLTEYAAGPEFYDKTFESETEQTATSDDEQEPQPPPHEPPPRPRRGQSNAAVRKCPFCAQEIQDDAVQCNYCHESVSGISFPFEVKGLSLSFEGFGYKGKRYEYDEITSLLFHSKRTDHQVMPGPSFSNYSIHLGIRVKRGETIIIKSWRVSQLSYGLPELEKGKTWLGKIGWEKHSKIELAYSLLRIRSLNNRFQFYLNQFNKHGYINYESVRIYNNGIVEQGSKRVDLTVAEKRKLLSFGRASRFGDRYDPFLVQVSESGFDLFDKKILFKTYTDADIIRFILGELAKGKPLRYGS